jgi:hypothetical protein
MLSTKKASATQLSVNKSKSALGDQVNKSARALNVNNSASATATATATTDMHAQCSATADEVNKSARATAVL